MALRKSAGSVYQSEDKDIKSRVESLMGKAERLNIEVKKNNKEADALDARRKLLGEQLEKGVAEYNERFGAKLKPNLDSILNELEKQCKKLELDYEKLKNAMDAGVPVGSDFITGDEVDEDEFSGGGAEDLDEVDESAMEAVEDEDDEFSDDDFDLEDSEDIGVDEEEDSVSEEFDDEDFSDEEDFSDDDFEEEQVLQKQMAKATVKAGTKSSAEAATGNKAKKEEEFEEFDNFSDDESDAGDDFDDFDDEFDLSSDDEADSEVIVPVGGSRASKKRAEMSEEFDEETSDSGVSPSKIQSDFLKLINKRGGKL